MRNKFFTDRFGCKCNVVRRKTPVGLRYDVMWCAYGRWHTQHLCSNMYARTARAARSQYEKSIDSLIDWIFK